MTSLEEILKDSSYPPNEIRNEILNDKIINRNDGLPLSIIIIDGNNRKIYRVDDAHNFEECLEKRHRKGEPSVDFAEKMCKEMGYQISPYYISKSYIRHTQWFIEGGNSKKEYHIFKTLFNLKR
jgi:hypothetical protein